jgi:hypothetical protein
VTVVLLLALLIHSRHLQECTYRAVSRGQEISVLCLISCVKFVQCSLVCVYMCVLGL